MQTAKVLQALPHTNAGGRGRKTLRRRFLWERQAFPARLQSQSTSAASPALPPQCPATPLSRAGPCAGEVSGAPCSGGGIIVTIPAKAWINEINNSTCSAGKMAGRGLFNQTGGTHPFSSSSRHKASQQHETTVTPLLRCLFAFHCLLPFNISSSLSSPSPCVGFIYSLSTHPKPPPLLLLLISLPIPKNIC